MKKVKLIGLVCLATVMMIACSKSDNTNENKTTGNNKVETTTVRNDENVTTEEVTTEEITTEEITEVPTTVKSEFDDENRELEFFELHKWTSEYGGDLITYDGKVETIEWDGNVRTSTYRILEKRVGEDGDYVAYDIEFTDEYGTHVELFVIYEPVEGECDYAMEISMEGEENPIFRVLAEE